MRSAGGRIPDRCRDTTHAHASISITSTASTSRTTAATTLTTTPTPTSWRSIELQALLQQGSDGQVERF